MAKPASTDKPEPQIATAPAAPAEGGSYVRDPSSGELTRLVEPPTQLPPAAPEETI